MRNGTKALALSCLAFFVLNGCASGPAQKAKGPTYSLIFDQSIMSDSRTLASWMSYCGTIDKDMEAYDAANPDGGYFVPFAVELEARQRILQTYAEIGENVELKDKSVDPYIGDMMRISEAGYMKEYVYYSFNPGQWEKPADLHEVEYRAWIQANLPDHKPLTLGRVEKVAK